MIRGRLTRRLLSGPINQVPLVLEGAVTTGDTHYDLVSLDEIFRRYEGKLISITIIIEEEEDAIERRPGYKQHPKFLGDRGRWD